MCTHVCTSTYINMRVLWVSKLQLSMTMALCSTMPNVAIVSFHMCAKVYLILLVSVLLISLCRTTSEIGRQKKALFEAHTEERGRNGKKAEVKREKYKPTTERLSFLLFYWIILTMMLFTFLSFDIFFVFFFSVARSMHLSTSNIMIVKW